MCVGRWRRDAVPCVPAYFIPFPPVVISYRFAARFNAVSLFRPVSRVDGRGAIWCLPRLVFHLGGLCSCVFDVMSGWRR